MKSLRSLTALLLVAVLVASFAATAAAATVTVTANGKRVSATVVSVYIDGVKLQADAYAISGRTLAPFRAIFEALGATVGWDDATQTASGTKNGLTIRLQINNPNAYVGDQVQVLTVPAMFINGRTYAPVRFVAEALGGTLNFDPVANRVDITSQAGPVEQNLNVPPAPTASMIRHGGTINPNGEVWGPGDHLVTDSFYVQATGDSATTPYLDIQAGARVFFNKDTEIVVGQDGAGGLRINGTADRPVQLAANSTNPQPGFWNGIDIEAGATEDSVINNAVIWHAGDNWGSLVLWGGEGVSSITVTDTAFVKNLGYAIRLRSGCSLSSSSKNITITGTVADPNEDGSGCPILTSEDGLSTLPLGQYYGNEVNAVYLNIGTIERATTLRNIGIPYFTSESIYVDGSNAKLTVEPGVKVFFASDSCTVNIGYEGTAALIADATVLPSSSTYQWDAFDVNSYENILREGLRLGYAALAPNYNGTPAGKNPAIVFAPYDPEAGAGAWNGIQLDNGSLPTTKLVGVVISDGGSDRGATSAGIWAQNEGRNPAAGNFKLAYSLIRGSSANGLKFWDDVKLSADSVKNTVEDCAGAFELGDGNSLGSLGSDWVFNNIEQANIMVTNYTEIAKSMTIKSIGLPIELLGDLIVDAPNVKLTLMPGVNMQFGSGVGLDIGSDLGGVLEILGDAANPVTLTGIDGAEWAGVLVGEAASTASKINNALIEGAETGLEALVDITKNVTNSTFRACETALNFAVETTQSIWDAIWDAFSNAGNIIENCAEEFVNAVVPEEE